MQKRFNSEKEISNDEAVNLIRHILDCGTVHFSRHANERMGHKNFTIQDVLYILETGVVVDKKFDDDRRNWKYIVKGNDLEGDSGSVVTAILTAQAQLIITTF